MAEEPETPKEFKLWKVCQFFNLPHDKDFTDEELDNLYNKLRLLYVLDTEEFPKQSLF